MLRLYTAFPVTAATAERTLFVLMRLKKTFLGATTTQERLNSLLMLHVYKVRTDHLDLTKVANEFVQPNERRRKHLGHF